MKSSKTRRAVEARAAVKTAPTPKPLVTPARIALALGGLLVLAFLIYSPVLNGPFVFDDRYLPFLDPTVGTSLRSWLNVRPFLMFSYWATYMVWGLDPAPYHAFNIGFHAINTALIYLGLRKLIGYAGEETAARREVLAGLGAAIFLAHPVQTESVAYIASRSEVLSVFFFLSAFVIYLYRRDRGLSWPAVGAVLLLFGAGVSTKEHIMALPAALLLTDLFWDRTAGLRKNFRLYTAFIVGVIVGAYPIWRVLRESPMIGFKMQDLTWYEYLFTQFRVIWAYLRLYVLPFGQNIDYDIPVSRSLGDHLAFLALAGLVALIAAALWYRNRFPLAAYGLLLFLILLAPTSSIVPIRDVIAERRMYLPFLGLLLITIDFARRLRWDVVRYGVATAAITLVLSGLTMARNQLWANELLMWQDSAEKSPGKVRPRFQLAFTKYQNGDCAGAVTDFETAAKIEKPNFDLLLDWALALDCAGKPNEALAKLQQAEKIHPSGHLYASMGMLFGKQGRSAEALDVLNKAEAADPNFAMTYVYRGNVYMQLGQPGRAIPEYERALRLAPKNDAARQTLAIARRQAQQSR